MLSRESYLSGKRVLVTGASSGIGWALAKAYATEGATLALVARRADRLAALAAEITATGGAEPLVIAADLAEPGRAAGVADQLGSVDVLVNNAGSAVGGTTWAVADKAAARQSFEVDFWTPLALIGALVPGMRKRGHGVVVNVTSLRQVLAWPSFGHSSAANAALAQSTEVLRLELLDSGVHVVEVVPGPIDTPAMGPSRLIPGFVDAVHGRFGTASAEEIAGMIVHASRDGAEKVFCPEQSTKDAYENPTALRAAMTAEVRRLRTTQPELPDEVRDTLVVGADHPMIIQAREAWEREHGAVPS